MSAQVYTKVTCGSVQMSSGPEGSSGDENHPDGVQPHTDVQQSADITELGTGRCEWSTQSPVIPRTSTHLLRLP